MAVAPEASRANTTSALVEAQVALAGGAVGAVTLEAAVREDRPDVQREVDALGQVIDLGPGTPQPRAERGQKRDDRARTSRAI